LEHEISYLNINNYKKGFTTFGAYTDYDFYCLRNVLDTDIETKIVDIDDKIEYIKLSNVQFIPKCNVREVLSLVAKEGEETVNILANSSYHTQRPHTENERNNEFKYPCIQNVNNNDEASCVWYSNINNKGHFGISKIIFGRKNCGVYVDENGEYGMAQDGVAIVDEVDNLVLIKKALKSEYFIKNIMGFRESFGDKYNRRIIATFRKDFWKEFV